MGIARFATVVCLIALASQPACAQPSSEIQNVELAAARYVIARHDSAVIHIDSVFAEPGSAPGVRTTRRRPAHRSRLLADSLSAVISDRRTVRSVHLLLSEPEFHDQQATICVTATYTMSANRSIVGYETLELTLRRQGGTWRVERVIQLGIS